MRHFTVLTRHDVRAENADEAAKLIRLYEENAAFRRAMQAVMVTPGGREEMAKIPSSTIEARTVCFEEIPERATDDAFVSRGRLLVELSGAPGGIEKPVYVDLQIGESVRRVVDVEYLPAVGASLTTQILASREEA